MSDPNSSTCGDGLCRREFLARCAAGSLMVGLATGWPGRLLADQGPMVWAEGREGPGPDEVRYPLPADGEVSVDRDRELILVRDAGAVYAFALSCPHQRSMLKWREKEGRFRCTKHGSKYEPSGEYVSGRATRGMDRYGVRVEAGQLVVSLDRKFLQDEDPAGWDAASAQVG